MNDRLDEQGSRSHGIRERHGARKGEFPTESERSALERQDQLGWPVPPFEHGVSEERTLGLDDVGRVTRARTARHQVVHHRHHLADTPVWLDVEPPGRRAEYWSVA